MITKSPLYDKATGSMGKITAYTTNNQVSIRKKNRPRYKASPAQLAIRSAKQLSNNLWQTLTTAQRDNWNNHAKLIKRTNKIGNPITLSGLNLFTSYYMEASAVGIIAEKSGESLSADTAYQNTKVFELEKNPGGDNSLSIINPHPDIAKIAIFKGQETNTNTNKYRGSFTFQAIQENGNIFNNIISENQLVGNIQYIRVYSNPAIGNEPIQIAEIQASINNGFNVATGKGDIPVLTNNLFTEESGYVTDYEFILDLGRPYLIERIRTANINQEENLLNRELIQVAGPDKIFSDVNLRRINNSDNTLLESYPTRAQIEKVVDRKPRKWLKIKAFDSNNHFMGSEIIYNDDD